MRCPHCLSERKPQEVNRPLPWFLAPLGLLVKTVRCDACLCCYYRVRFVGWLIKREEFFELL